MAEQKISFNDGGLYERTMGVWSRLAGDTFLDWLNPAPSQDWIDVGCGNGAFTDLIANRCAPGSVVGIDPSADQIAYARDRAPDGIAKYQEGNALDLPYSDASFDIAVMALVIFFVPEPPKGVAEMARVVRPGGWVTSYSWDILGGGFPVALLREEMQAMGIPILLPPRMSQE
jgi:ubiquinone/menaquinone biosynthesis C-methylase UbiE